MKKREINTKLEKNKRDRENKMDRKEVRETTKDQLMNPNRTRGGKTQGARNKNRKGNKRA